MRKLSLKNIKSVSASEVILAAIAIMLMLIYFKMPTVVRDEQEVYVLRRRNEAFRRQQQRLSRPTSSSDQVLSWEEFMRAKSYPAEPEGK